MGTPLQRREALYTYDGNGRKLSLTDARGFRAEMKYDGHGRQSRWVFPSKTTPGIADASDYEQYGYDPAGNRTSLRKRDGQVIGFEHDALNRVIVKTVLAFGMNVRYAYDLRGLQTRAWFTGNDWGISNAWDGFGRLVSTTSNMGGFSRTVSRQYDREGRRIEIAFPDGQKFWTARDGLGRAIDDYQGAHGSTAHIMTAFAYNPAGQRSYFARRFGDMTSYGYDAAGRLNLQIDGGFAGGTGDTRSDYVHNPASQLHTESRTNDSYAWTGSVAVSRSYAVNGQNQYTGTTSNGAASATFTHDPNGNLTSDGTTTFAYDVENRLVSASGSHSASLVYDPLGRLFQTSGGAGGITQFLYDDDALIGEYDSAGGMPHRYIHGPAKGVDDPLIWYHNSAAGWRWALVSDQQGSIIAVADMYGNPIATNAYDEYGIPDARNQGRFQYTGQAWIPELGMYYYKARIYSPTLGRFLQVDPIGYDDQINLYAYVGNDPVNMGDPTGTEGACFYTPSQCGMRKLTQEQERLRQKTLSTLVNVALLGASAIPVVRGLAWLGRALGIGRATVPAISQATRTALGGGRHNGALRELAGRTNQQVQRTIRGHERQIREHREKIQNPQRFMKRDDPNDPKAVERAVRDWEKTIKRHEELRDIATDVLRSR